MNILVRVLLIALTNNTIRCSTTTFYISSKVKKMCVPFRVSCL